MTRVRLSLAALIAVGAGVGLVASCSRGVPPEGPSGGAAARRIEALELPGTETAPRRRCDFVWAAGVAKAASMYFPREMPVYEVVRVTPKETAAAVAAALGESLPAEADDGAVGGTEAHRVRLGDTWVSGYADGRYAIVYVERVGPAEPTGSRLPDAAETAAVAMEFLGEHKGLLPKGARPLEVGAIAEISNWEMGDAWRSGVGPLGPTQVATFRRLHEGFPEGRLTVLVNSDGEVCAVINRMPNLALIGSYPMLSPEEAAGTLNSAAAERYGLDAADIVGAARIEEVEMEYFDGIRGRWPRTVQPTYTFSGSVETEVGGRAPFLVTVPAIRKEYTERESSGR